MCNLAMPSVDENNPSPPSDRFAVVSASSRQSRKALLCLPQAFDMSRLLHTITSSRFKATSKISAAWLQLVLFRPLSESQQVAPLNTQVGWFRHGDFCLVSEEAVIINRQAWLQKTDSSWLILMNYV